MPTAPDVAKLFASNEAARFCRRTPEAFRPAGNSDKQEKRLRTWQAMGTGG